MHDSVILVRYSKYMKPLNAYLLPGNSPRHREWVETFKQAIAPQFETVKTQHYQHWETGESHAAVSEEINIAAHNTKNLSPYILIAKSIGTVIATQAVAQSILSPEKIILLGIPLRGAIDRRTFVASLKTIPCPVTIIQNTADPFGSFEEIYSTLSGLGAHITFVEFPGKTHDYLDFSAISRHF